MLKKITGYFYKNTEAQTLALQAPAESLYLEDSCLQYFEEANIKAHVLKMVSNFEGPRATYKLDDVRYGIDSALYLYIQNYDFKAITGALAIASMAINYSREGLKSMFKRYGYRVMQYFPKIDTRPKTMQERKTFGIFSLVRNKTDTIVMMRFAELTVPARIYWSSRSERIRDSAPSGPANEITQVMEPMDCYTASSVDITDEVLDAFCITYVHGSEKQYRYVRF